MTEQLKITTECLLCHDTFDQSTMQMNDDGEHGMCEGCFNEASESMEWQCESCLDYYLSYPSAYDYRISHFISNIVCSVRSMYITNWLEVNDGEGFYCDNCVYSCGNCGEMWSNIDNMEESCCYEESNRSELIYHYGYKPNPFMFWVTPPGSVPSARSSHEAAAYSLNQAPSSVLFIGMELEMEKAMRILNDAWNKFREPNRFTPSFLYFKTDGSLSPNGIELVTMPSTLETFKERFPWEGLEHLHYLGARSFGYESCGMHFHLSKKSFTAPHMWRFVKFHTKNNELCIQIARRKDSHWASWDSTDIESKLPDVIKGKTNNMNRYVALNFQNRETLELRYFKGNLIKEGILRNMEFIQSIYDFTKNLSSESIRNGDLSNAIHPHSRYRGFVRNNQELYPNLHLEIEGKTDEEI